MEDLGKKLFELHWESVRRQYPNENIDELALGWDASDEVVKQTWRDTASSFMEFLHG